MIVFYMIQRRGSLQTLIPGYTCSQWSPLFKWFSVSNVTAVGVERFDIAQKIPTASIYLMFFIYGFMDPQLKRAFKRALRCYRFGNENTDHNCIRNRIETGLPGDTEMKVWTATITKKSNSILAGNLSKGLNAKET